MHKNTNGYDGMSRMMVKPSKPLSAGMIVVLIFMLLFGMGFAVFSLRDVFDGDELALKILLPLFFSAFIGTIVFMLVYHVRNLKRPKGLSLIDVEADSGGGGVSGDVDFDVRLRKVESLHKDGLITEGRI